MEPKKITNIHKVLSVIPFAVEEIHFTPQGAETETPYYRLQSPDWVNVLPVTSDGRIILIEQYRVGSNRITLETPGGTLNPDEKDPTMTAARELEEETGFTSMRFLPLGSFNPNPAIMSNRCHFFIALGCQFNSERKHFPDPGENIELKLFQPREIEDMVRFGQIDHALAALCIMLGLKYLKGATP